MVMYPLVRLGQAQAPAPVPAETPEAPKPLDPAQKAFVEKGLFEVMVKTAIVSGGIGLLLGVLVVSPILEKK